ncbi:MAG: hypothetical protein IJT49_05005 [Clostridia bacterium]|nr:hypothetical protein [Clostridia bacterium]
MKKILCLLLAAVFAAAIFAGCTGKSGGSDTEPAGTASKTDGESADEQTKDSSSQTDPQLSAEFENLKATDKFTFGTWNQDESSGGEPITWIVLRQDVGKMLVLSEKILEYMCFKNGTDENKYPRALYKDSDLRSFLNGDFYNIAFTDTEKAMILTSKITTMYKDESYNELTYETEDKVFALSKDESARYVSGIGTIIYGIPTQRVDNENPYATSSISGVSGVEKAMPWWLRDMGTDSNKYAAYVTARTTHKYNDDEKVYEYAGVRPAMWIVYNEKDMNGYAKGEIQPKADAELDAKIAALKIGDKLQFGVYDDNLYSVDGFNSLTWTVYNEDDASFYILSDTIAGSGYSVFDDNRDAEDTSWAESYLRKYINSTAFLDMTFSPQEKAKLVLTHIVSSGEDDRNGGAETDDLLFVPDASDVDNYPELFKNSIGHKYWLRSQRSFAPYIAYVSGGSVSSSRPTENYGIRLMARIIKKG